MNLHEDKLAFLNIINLVHEDSGIRSDILEKDYYVTLLLRELAGKQAELPAYFKGGTALYKAQKSIRRFSEDIDLTVCIDNCSNNQAKKRLELATKKYQSLPRTSRKELEDDRKGSITAVYDYAPLVGIDSDDPLQRFGYVKVEGTSFTVSEPFTPLEIEPILYTYATEEQRQILQAQYDVGPFRINTIRLERIFADKIFAAEFYDERNGTSKYSESLFRQIIVSINRIAINPLLGHMTEYPHVRYVVVIPNYSVFYYFADDVITVLVLWDNRRNPARLTYILHDSDPMYLCEDLETYK